MQAEQAIAVTRFQDKGQVRSQFTKCGILVSLEKRCISKYIYILYIIIYIIWYIRLCYWRWVRNLRVAIPLSEIERQRDQKMELTPTTSSSVPDWENMMAEQTKN